MTTAFYAPPDAVHGRRLVLPPDEARHATRALRHGPGDEVFVVDGEGRRHRVRLESAGQQKVVGTILATEEDVGEPPYRLTVGLGLLKKRSRFETFLEKAVELGVSRILPLQTRYAEKETIRRERAERILRAGLKQSGRSRLPRLSAPTPLREVLGDAGAFDHVLIAHRAATDRGSRPIAQALADWPAHADRPCRVLVLVGPEGGFAGEEVEAAASAGAHVVSMGPRRLRAETAAITAAAALMLSLEG